MDGRSPEQRRRLVVVGDDGAGEVIDIPDRVSLLGREEAADIRLPFDGVSRRHATLDATGPAVVLVDLQSRNGTWVNGRRLDGPIVLRHGDLLTVGPVRLRYVDAAAAGEPGGRPPRRAGSGDAYTAERDQFIAARDQNWNQTVNVLGEDATDEIFEGRGPGRVIAIVGMVVALAGFAWAGYTFFTLATYQGPDIPEFPPQFGYAFAMFALGGILAAIGGGMSRARRRREGG